MLKACKDYTDKDRHNDYIRHRRVPEKPCQPSLQAWRKRQRRVRQENR